MQSANEVHYGGGFVRDARKIPKQAQEKLATLIVFLTNDVFDHRLHTKRLDSPLQDVFAFRITRGWRVGFIFIASHSIKLLAVDDRGQIYQKLKRLLQR